MCKFAQIWPSYKLVKNHTLPTSLKPYTHFVLPVPQLNEMLLDRVAATLGSSIPSAAKCALPTLVMDAMCIHSEPTPRSSIPVACHGRAALGSGVRNEKSGKVGWRSEGQRFERDVVKKKVS